MTARKNTSLQTKTHSSGSGSPDLIFRPFRNSDPPKLVQIWNESQLGRGAVVPLEVEEFCSLVLAKLHFESAGLIVACEGDCPIGFVHAGFGAVADGRQLSQREGVICAAIVHPTWRRRGIGRQLVSQAEQYLAERGAEVVSAGARPPMSPFYWGLYGGSNLPGFLESDPAAGPFFEACGYRPMERRLVWQRDLSRPLGAFDLRFAQLRRWVQVQTNNGPPEANWWRATLTAPMDSWWVRLIRKDAGPVLAQVMCWHMAGFSRSWGKGAVGLMNIEVFQEYRRQGLAKWLLFEVLRQLRNEAVEVVEVHTPESDLASRGLLASLGFEVVDRGTVFRRGQPADAIPADANTG